MTSRIAFAVFLVCLLVSGCGDLFHIGARNLFNEAKLIRDNRCEQVRYTYLAREAWERVKGGCPTGTYSADYAEGFKAGFVDYLYAGGSGEPPAMPPKRYRYFHAESPAGAKALQDWYGGFRHGAAAAKASGLRQFVVVSLPSPNPAPLPPPPPPLVGVPLGEPSPTGPSPPLPTPRRMPAEATPKAKGTPAVPLEDRQSPPSGEADEPRGEQTETEPAIEGSATAKPAPEE